MIRWVILCLQLFLPTWRQAIRPDSNHAYGRTLTKRHLAKRSVVKNFWICSSILMILVPVMPVVVGLGLFTTFLSFMYLDEA